MTSFTPSYLSMDPEELLERVEALNALASPCSLCPRRCHSRRSEGEKGYCRTGFDPVVSSAHPHYGEERALSGTGGSGTIFLTNCNLGCTFCQNYDISHHGKGQAVTLEELASLMLGLQDAGCHNINFVTPTHQIHAIVEAVGLAASRGLSLPLVYNTGGYDSVRTLQLLDGVFDIFMPDLKFMDRETSATLADAVDYPEVALSALREMHRQVGDLLTDGDGIARRGLLVRHLVLPQGLAGSDDAFRFIAQQVSTGTCLNIMAQYRPCHEAVGQPGIGSPLSQEDFINALELARKWGLRRLD